MPDRVYRPNIFGAKSTGRAGSYVEDRLNNCIIMDANDEQDNISDFLYDPSQHGTDTVSPDETIISLKEKFDETKLTCEAIKQQLADLVKSVGSKKLSGNK